MDAEQRALAPANFQFVEGLGIHPFYLGMEIDQVFEAAIGWKIKMIERDPRGASVNVHFEIRRKVIEVDLINTLFADSGAKSHFQVYGISTESPRFSEGMPFSRMDRDDIISKFKGDSELVRDNELSDDDEINGNSGYYRSKGGHIFFIYKKHGRHLLSIGRMP